MIFQILLGAAIISATVLTTVGLFVCTAGFLTKLSDWLNSGTKLLRMIVVLMGVILSLLLALGIAIWIWAMAFLWVGEFTLTEEAVYFSMVSFTTLGFGDVIVSKEWRLLSGMVAANGFLLFSMATAFLIEFLTQIRDAQLDRDV